VDRNGGDGPIGYGDIAVLLRGIREYRVVPAIERAFRAAGIPYVILGGADAAGSRALESLYAYLSLLLPGDRRLELLHCLESRPVKVGQAALAELFARDGAQPGNRHVLLSDERISRVTDADARERIFALRSILDSLDGARASMDFRRFLSLAMETTPFLLRMFAEGATARSVEDLIGELWEICNTLDAKRELGLWSFLDYLRASIDGRSFGKVEPLAVPPNHVRVMTIHQAKGLEFPAVAVAGVKPLQNDTSGFFLSKTEGLFSEKWKDWNRAYKNTDGREPEIEMRRQEERCLLYVAMTRAHDYLFVSTPYADPDKTLFGDVLAAVEEGGIPGAVIRSAPAGARAAAPADRLDAVDAQDVSDAVAQWKVTREAHARQLGSPLTTPEPLHFVNWTALKAFAVCPLRYRFRYVLRVGDPFGDEGSSDDSAATEKGDRIGSVQIPRGITPVRYGLLVHELLRNFMETRAVEGEPRDGWIEAAVEKSGVETNRRRGVVASASKLIDTFASSGLSAPVDGMRLEEPFQVRFDRTVYHGIFDRVEKTDDGWLVTDYKIGQDREEYAFQVAFYAWALEKITGGEDVAGRLCYLRENEVKLVVVSPGDMAVHARELEDRLRDGAFAASPGDACGDCPYATACPETVR
jgi:ATP-dependent exoDNAse (exonuclease V) beta subunit